MDLSEFAVGSRIAITVISSSRGSEQVRRRDLWSIVWLGSSLGLIFMRTGTGFAIITRMAVAAAKP